MDKIEALQRRQELLEIEAELMKYDFRLYQQVEHLLEKRNDMYRDIICDDKK